MTQGCASWRDDLAALVLGALDAGDRAAMKRHLSTCPECRAAYWELLPVRDWLTRTSQHLTACQDCRAYYEDLVRPHLAR
jgi:predicted anti-sigma-YlaC factor YlaD